MKPLDADEVAARIRACRAHARLTRRELAEKMGTSPSTVERWEKAHAGSLGGEDRARMQTILWDVAKACDLDPAWAVSDWDVPPTYRVQESDVRDITARLRRIEVAVGLEDSPKADDAGIAIAELMEMLGGGASWMTWAGGEESPAVKQFGRLLDLLEEDPERIDQFRRVFGVAAPTPSRSGEQPEDVADEIERQGTGRAGSKVSATESPKGAGSRGRGRSR